MHVFARGPNLIAPRIVMNTPTKNPPNMHTVENCDAFLSSKALRKLVNHSLDYLPKICPHTHVYCSKVAPA